jgi:arylsulfatase
LDLPAGAASGVIVAQGGRYGGFTLYVKDGHVTYETNISGHNTGKLVADTPLPAGKVHIALEFVPAGSGPSAAASAESLDIGADLESPVTPSYASPFTFSGKVERVTVDLKN